MTVEEVLAALAPSILQGIEEPDLRAIAETSIIVQFPPGCEVLEQGKVPQFAFLVVEGTVQMRSRMDGRVATVAMMRAGQFCGLPGLLLDQPSTCASVSMGSVKLLMIPAAELRRLASASAPVGLALAREVARLSRTLEAELVSQKLRSAVERVAAWLVAEQRRTGSMSFDLGMSRRSLAHFVGASEETLSRVMRIVEASGVTLTGQRVQIVDYHALRRLAAPEALLDIDAAPPAPVTLVGATG
jgi:CRP/FNR family transcriptional activator FtrB